MKIHGTAKGGALSTKDFGVAFGNGAVSPDFETDFPNADLWQEVSTPFYVSGNAMHNGGAGNNVDARMYLTAGLGFTLSNSQWAIRWTYKCTSGGGGVESGVPIYVSNEVQKPLYASFESISCFQTNGFPLQTSYTNNSGFVLGTPSNALTSGTEYYIQLQRTSETAISLTIYEDPTFDSEFQAPITQTISSDVQDLNQLAISSTDNGGSATPQSDWYVKDLKVYNNHNF